MIDVSTFWRLGTGKPHERDAKNGKISVGVEANPSNFPDVGVEELRTSNSATVITKKQLLLTKG